MTEYIYKHISKSGEDSHGNLVSLPTMVRREEIVRCRDCAKLNTMNCPCAWFPLDNKLDGFCAWAVKR